MFQLTTLLRSFRALGASGAVANVHAVLESRAREDWLIEGLARRLEAAPVRPAVVAPARVVQAV